MSVVSMKQLLEAGVHFGHPTRKWNPKMKKYIYTARNDIHILNLEQTVELIDEAYAFVKQQVTEGKSILFVGTKKQAAEAIQQEAERCGQFFINTRWLGGTLTNFTTIRSRVDRLNRLNQMEKLGEFDLLPKKEVLKLKAERDKLQLNLGGIKEMRTLPGVIFIIDPKKEHIAIREARATKIPIIGLVDTNCDPDEVDYIIPGNDDAIRAVKLIAGTIADAVIEAHEGEQGALAVKAETDTEEKIELTDIDNIAVDLNAELLAKIEDTDAQSAKAKPSVKIEEESKTVEEAIAPKAKAKSIIKEKEEIAEEAKEAAPKAEKKSAAKAEGDVATKKKKEKTEDTVSTEAKPEKKTVKKTAELGEDVVLAEEKKPVKKAKKADTVVE